MRLRLTVCLLALTLLPQFADAQQKKTGVPRFDVAVQRGAAYLKANVLLDGDPSRVVLAAYALFKTGEPVETPMIQQALAHIESTVASGSFHPHLAYDHLYESGLYCMFLADVNAEKYKPQIQIIADYVSSVQRPNGSWADAPGQAGDISMCQYAVLALWAANRAKCTVSPETLDRTVNFHMAHRSQGGGWSYRPEIPGQPTTRNMTMAGISTLGVTRLLYFGPESLSKPKEVETKFGVLEKDVEDADKKEFRGFPGYRPQNGKAALNAGIDQAIAYEVANFNPVNSHQLFPIYFYYSAERALSVTEIDTIKGLDWYVAYGDGLLTLQAQDGSFKEPHVGPIIGTSFALLYYMRSTKNILDKTYGDGLQQSNKGNPFGDKSKQKPPTELDLLIADLEKMPIDIDETPPDFANELVRSVIAIDDWSTLIGQEDRLRKLVEHPKWEVRQACCWALGRTGKFELIPLMLDMLRDPQIEVNVEAIQALRNISRKPTGFGETLDPLNGLENPTPEVKLRVTNEWRQKTLKAWSEWYNSVRPHEEKDTFEELLLAVPISTKGVNQNSSPPPAK